jgi:23S rRNA (adenine2503-C2)-methyltransferase
MVEKNISVPTGNILIVDGDKGQLEMVVLGDYGKEINLNQNKEVKDNLPLLPLTDKWVITISTQYSCKMNCQFCDVPRVINRSPNINATFEDLRKQVLVGLNLYPEVKYSNRLNIHYARMGEPTFNPNVLEHTGWLYDYINPNYNVHPVVSTMMPKNNNWLKRFIHEWCRIKNILYNGNAGLQFSINSTNENQRDKIFSGNALKLSEIASIMSLEEPLGRKYTLNFAVCDDWEINPDILLRNFEPERFLIKLTPVHKTYRANKFGYDTGENYTTPEPYQKKAYELRQAGYDVLVFIASEDEDMGMITCGNAILANTKEPKKREQPINFMGNSPIGINDFRKWDTNKDKYEERI